MWPFLEMWGFRIPTYNLVLALGVLAGFATLIFAARRKRVPLQFLADHFFILFIATLFLARLVEVWLYNYPLLELPFFWQESGGFNLYGGVIGFLLTLAYLCHRYNETFFKWLDLSVFSAAATLLFHHFGTFLSGSAYGIPTNLPWGITFTNPDSAVLTTLPIHPTQIYGTLLTLVFIIFATVIFKRTKAPGKAGIFLLLTLSLTYFSIDFLRGDSAPTFGGLRASQYFTLGLAIIAAILVIKMKRMVLMARSDELHIR